jgi:hypothetical protein
MHPSSLQLYVLQTFETPASPIRILVPPSPAQLFPYVYDLYIGRRSLSCPYRRDLDRGVNRSRTGIGSIKTVRDTGLFLSLDLFCKA